MLQRRQKHLKHRRQRETEEPEPETETEEPVITKEPEATPAETEKAEKAEDKAEVSQTPEAETTPETKKDEPSQWQSEAIKKKAVAHQPAKQTVVAEPVIKTAATGSEGGL